MSSVTSPEQYFLVNVITGEIYGGFHNSGAAWRWLLGEQWSSLPYVEQSSGRLEAIEKGWEIVERDVSYGTLQIASHTEPPYRAADINTRFYEQQPPNAAYQDRARVAQLEQGIAWAVQLIKRNRDHSIESAVEQLEALLTRKNLP
jgi:hypothetical protein